MNAVRSAATRTVAFHRQNRAPMVGSVSLTGEASELLRYMAGTRVPELFIVSAK